MGRKKLTDEQKKLSDARRKEYRRAYKARNAELIRQQAKEYKLRNADKIRAYNAATKGMQKIRSARRYERHKEMELAKAKIYYQENKEKIQAHNKEWRKKNRDRVRKVDRAYIKNRLENDPAFRVLALCRRRMSNALVGVGEKSARTVELLGCTGAELVTHIERQFKPSMSWANRREWHIDHIKPVAKFDLSDSAQQRACFHYSNLQPLWSQENRRKAAKYTE